MSERRSICITDWPISRFNAEPDTDPLSVALDELEAAARIGRMIQSGRYDRDRIDSVTHRTADALTLLRDYCDQQWPQGHRTPGVNCSTGRGGCLAPSAVKGGRKSDGRRNFSGAR